MSGCKTRVIRLSAFYPLAEGWAIEMIVGGKDDVGHKCMQSVSCKRMLKADKRMQTRVIRLSAFYPLAEGWAIEMVVCSKDNADHTIQQLFST